MNLWVGRFAGACQRSVSDAASLEMRIRQIRSEWRTRLGRVRANSAADLLIRAIAGAPVLTVGGAAALISRSYPQTNAAIERLVSAGILSQITVGRRNRAFEAPAIVNAFTDLERQLASTDLSVCTRREGVTGPSRSTQRAAATTAGPVPAAGWPSGHPAPAWRVLRNGSVDARSSVSRDSSEAVAKQRSASPSRGAAGPA